MDNKIPCIAGDFLVLVTPRTTGKKQNVVKDGGDGLECTSNVRERCCIQYLMNSYHFS